MINYTKRNINIISFCISLIIFFLIIYFLKYLSLKLNQNSIKTSYQNEIKNSEEQSNFVNEDITLEEIKDWKIIIEKLNLEADIKEGTEENIIKENVGHFITSNLLYGNVALKAYNTGQNKNYFANLKELELRDEIKYIVNDNEYIYQVISNLIIDNQEEFISKHYKSKNEKNTLVLITFIKDMPTKMRCVICEEIKMKGE